MSESRLTNCGTGSSNWQMRTRRRAGMEKPRRSTPAASDKARLATSRDLPTLGSPPTNKMPCGGSQQDRFPNRRLFSRSRQTQRCQGQFVDLAENAFGGLIEGLSRGVVKQRLGHAGSLELLHEIGIEFFARESFEVILHSDALTQRFVQLQGESAAQQRLAHQQQGQIAARIHIEVQQQRELFERGMAQQLGFIADENRVLL